MNNPFVRVIEGLPDERALNAAISEELAAGARLVSLTIFGTDETKGRTVLLFEGKPGGPKRVANDTSVIERGPPRG